MLRYLLRPNVLGYSLTQNTSTPPTPAMYCMFFVKNFTNAILFSSIHFPKTKTETHAQFLMHMQIQLLFLASEMRMQILQQSGFSMSIQHVQKHLKYCLNTFWKQNFSRTKWCYFIFSYEHLYYYSYIIS